MHEQIKNEFIICGDFNAHHALWGGKHNDTKGNEMSEFILEQNNSAYEYRFRN